MNNQFQGFYAFGLPHDFGIEFITSGSYGIPL